METNKSYMSKDHKRSNKLSSSRLSINSPNELPPSDSDSKLTNPSRGANLLQRGYMRKKDIKDILKEEEQNVK